MRTSASNPIARALWYIESHSADAIGLDDIAAVAGLSRHHLVRAFGAVTGRSVMRHLRGRRLSQAARALAAGAPDILGVALDAGYGSHEAFTRAFREQFSLTPDAVRTRGLDGLTLVEPFIMDESRLAELGSPRFEDRAAFLVAGLVERCETVGAPGIPALWQRFASHLGTLSSQVGNAAYGVCWNGDDHATDYMAGAEVADFSDLPNEFSRLRIPAQRYAVFEHRGHVAAVPATWRAIWSKSLPEAGLKAADAPTFERYDERFDPRTGLGVFEIWVPLSS